MAPEPLSVTWGAVEGLAALSSLSTFSSLLLLAAPFGCLLLLEPEGRPLLAGGGAMSVRNGEAGIADKKALLRDKATELRDSLLAAENKIEKATLPRSSEFKFV
jgi:hypothetical protein